MSTYAMVSRHIEQALAEAAGKSISDDVVARCLLSEAIRLFKRSRSNDDIAAELSAARACIRVRRGAELQRQDARPEHLGRQCRQARERDGCKGDKRRD